MKPLQIVVQCDESLLPRVRYVLDSLFCACSIPVAYVNEPPSAGPWLFYGEIAQATGAMDRCVAIPHDRSAWKFFRGDSDITAVATAGGLITPLPPSRDVVGPWDVEFDIVASAFYFLSSWSERAGAGTGSNRGLYENSVFRRCEIPQDIVDQYLERIRWLLDAVCRRLEQETWRARQWPGDSAYAVVLSHDVDFLPDGMLDVAVQGAKTFLRHLLTQRDPLDALRSAVGLSKALLHGRDPFGCIPEIIAREKALGVRASYQVAVAHRHRNDVNYRVECERTRMRLKSIIDEGFELCLHGSYLSTEDPNWYVAEVETLAEHLARPIGSRQHFMSFNYDVLFRAQEKSGIQYDMSMGFPDRPGPRAGFSYPYFPYCLEEDRPYRVLQIGLTLMDVTLRGYMRLKGPAAWAVIAAELDRLKRQRGCASTVWHPIVFGGARDPGYDELFWDMVQYIVRAGGAATDGRTINAFWRNCASAYPSFSWP